MTNVFVYSVAPSLKWEDDTIYQRIANISEQLGNSIILLDDTIIPRNSGWISLVNSENVITLPIIEAIDIYLDKYDKDCLGPYPKSIVNDIITHELLHMVKMYHNVIVVTSLSYSSSDTTGVWRVLNDMEVDGHIAWYHNKTTEKDKKKVSNRNDERS
jgi:hypothetical protein